MCHHSNHIIHKRKQTEAFREEDSANNANNSENHFKPDSMYGLINDNFPVTAYQNTVIGPSTRT